MLPLPPRSASAPGGTAFVAATADLDVAQRNAAAVEQILAGNVPSWVRRLIPVSLQGTAGTATIYVIPDYIAIGSDADNLRMPLTLPAANALCRATDCWLPTPHMVDVIYAQASLKLAPQPIPPSDRMVSNECFLEHQHRVQAQLHTIDGGYERLAAGELVAGHKKDLVLTRDLTRRPGRVAIYGWHRPDGTAIQPVSTVHAEWYADYSHGVRLIWSTVLVNGEPRLLAEALADPVTADIFGDEGALGAQLLSQQ